MFLVKVHILMIGWLDKIWAPAAQWAIVDRLASIHSRWSRRIGPVTLSHNFQTWSHDEVFELCTSTISAGWLSRRVPVMEHCLITLNHDHMTMSVNYKTSLTIEQKHQQCSEESRCLGSRGNRAKAALTRGHRAAGAAAGHFCFSKRGNNKRSASGHDRYLPSTLW